MAKDDQFNTDINGSSANNANLTEEELLATVEKIRASYGQITADTRKVIQSLVDAAKAEQTKIQENLEKVKKMEIQNAMAISKIEKIDPAKLSQSLKLELAQRKRMQQELDKYTKNLEQKRQEELIAQEAAARHEMMMTNLKYEQNAAKKLGGTLFEKFASTEGHVGMKAVETSVKNAFKSVTEYLDGTIKEVSRYKQAWDTRLQGNLLENHSIITRTVNGIVGASPLIQSKTYMENINAAVEAGISYNIEQRAFLQTVKEGIADTFDAFDSNLMEIIKIQQEDTTAYRLGMESTLTKFLNRNYQDTSFMNNGRKTVTDSLTQAFAFTDAKNSIGLEYQAQKWLGALSSVGLSSSALSGIAGALGQLASGDVSGTDSGFGKLLVMSAARSGLDYADMLIDGLDGSEMNALMKSMVDYLQQIAKDAQGNAVVRSQMSSIYGLSVSDLRAAANLANTNKIYNEGKNYGAGSAMANLQWMNATYANRMDMGAMLTNAIDNFKYSLASNMVTNPMSYALYTISGMLGDTMEGINIPAFSVMGNMVDLETDVATLMRVGALAGPILGGLGSLVTSGLTGLLGPGTMGMFNALQLTSGAKNLVQRGSGFSLNETGISTSASTQIVSNSNSDDIQNGVTNAARNEGNEQLEVMKEEENEDTADSNTLHNDIRDVYDLLESLIDNGSMRVSYSGINDTAGGGMLD